MKLTLEFDLNDQAAAQTLQAIFSQALEVKVAPPVETKDDEAYDPDTRIFGQPGEKSRRTKAEMQLDEDIATRWAALWPSKDVPEKPVGELIATIQKVESRVEEETVEEEEFEIGDDEVLDLDEFRAILNKGMKALGGKVVGGIMSPHKSATDVPEADRRAYADKIEQAIDEA